MTEDEEETSTSLLSVAKWIISVGGLASAIYATGFVIAYARQDLLGIRIYGSEATDYAILAHRFYLDLVFLTFSGLFGFISKYLTWLVLLFVFFVIARIARNFAPQRVDGLRAAARIRWNPRRDPRGAANGAKLLVALALILLLFPLWNVDALTPITDTLLRRMTLSRSFLTHPLSAGRTTQLWEYTVCSRVYLEGCTRSEAASKQSLRGIFYWSTLLWSAALICLVVSHRRAGTKAPWRSWHVIAFAVLIVDLLLALPYVYAKLILPTETKEAIFAIGEEAREERVHGYVLYEGDNEIVALVKPEGNIWQIPRSEIHTIKVERLSDVLKFWILVSQESPVEPP